MAFLAGFIYYLTVFIVYCAAIFGAVKLGIVWRKKRERAGRWIKESGNYRGRKIYKNIRGLLWDRF